MTGEDTDRPGKSVRESAAGKHNMVTATANMTSFFYSILFHSAENKRRILAVFLDTRGSGSSAVATATDMRLSPR